MMVLVTLDCPTCHNKMVILAKPLSTSRGSCDCGHSLIIQYDIPIPEEVK